jgi:integrase
MAAAGRTLATATRGDIEEHRGELAKQLQPSSVATRYKALRVFYTWIEHEDETPSPMAKMSPPMVPEDRAVPVLGADELRRLLGTCAGRGIEDRRDLALMSFLLDTGARRPEIMGIKLEDVDFDLEGRWRPRQGPPRAGASFRAQDHARAGPLHPGARAGSPPQGW